MRTFSDSENELEYEGEDEDDDDDGEDGEGGDVEDGEMRRKVEGERVLKSGYLEKKGEKRKVSRSPLSAQVCSCWGREPVQMGFVALWASPPEREGDHRTETPPVGIARLTTVLNSQVADNRSSLSVRSDVEEAVVRLADGETVVLQGRPSEWPAGRRHASSPLAALTSSPPSIPAGVQAASAD